METVIAIIGGGRWGQVAMSVIAKIDVPFDRIVIVSKMNRIEIEKKIANINLTSSIPFEVVSTLSDLFSKYKVRAAIIVNSAGQHYETAYQMIKQRVHILIEKPVVLSIKQMNILIKEAAHKKIVLVPGLSYRFCSYIKNFSHEIVKKGIPRQLLFRWFDSAKEVRHGQIKRYDSSISIIQDVMPHVWTILSIIFSNPVLNFHTCFQDSPDTAEIDLSINNIKGNILLKRNAHERQRYLSLQFEENCLVLDFSQEPGIIFVDGKEISADPDWQKKPSPLALQLEYFFSMIKYGKSLPDDFQSCLASVTNSEIANSIRMIKVTKDTAIN